MSFQNMIHYYGKQEVDASAHNPEDMTAPVLYDGRTSSFAFATSNITDTPKPFPVTFVDSQNIQITIRTIVFF